MKETHFRKLHNNNNTNNMKNLNTLCLVNIGFFIVVCIVLDYLFV